MSTISPARPHAENPSAKTLASLVADCVVGIICVPALTAFAFGIALLLLTGNSPGHHDVVSYWTAGHQLLHHANPYDSEAVLRSELAAGVPTGAQALLVRNPPWALCLVLPLGVLGVPLGSLVWTLLLLGCFTASVQLIGTISREMAGQPQNKVHLLGYTFAPALLCVLTGQTSLFSLLGLVLFLKLYRARPFLAGSALYLCALKPHLFLPCAIVLLLWIVATHSYRLVLGFITTLSAASLAVTWFDPMVWTHYHQMMQTSGITAEFIACPAVALRFAIAPHAIWMQYLPAALGCAWAVLYYRKHRAEWDWMEHGALLLVVSILVSPYAWLTDQTILLPALLPVVISRNIASASAWPLRTLMLASAVIEMQQLYGVTMHSAWVLWTTPFWLAWFLVASARSAGSEPSFIELPPSFKAAAATQRIERPASPTRPLHTLESGSQTTAP